MRIVLKQWCIEQGANRGAATVRRVHAKNMVDRRDGESIAASDERRVDVVDQLSCIRHPDFLGVSVENIQCDARNKRVAKSRPVRPKVTGTDAGIGLMPCSPLVNHKLEFVIGIDFSHDLPVILDQLLHVTCVGQQRVPLLFVELS